MLDNATAETQAEAAWQESERRLQEVIGVTELSPDFRALFEATPRPFLVLASDLTIVAVNDAYLHATMTERAALLGQPLFDPFPDDPDDPAATGVRNLHASLERVLATGRADVMAEQRYPVRRPAAMGGGFEERWWSPVNAPVLGRDGKVALIIHSVVDITAQKRDQQALRESETRHRQILDSATDYAIIATDLQGRVTRWSAGARRVLGWTEEEMLGHTTERIFTPEDVAARIPKTEMQSALESGTATDERWHRRKGGERFWANGELTPLKDDAGEVIGFVKVLRDRTEQRRAEEHQRLLIHELNHRVKNTLATVQSLASQTLKSEHENSATWQAFEGRLFALAKAHDVLTREQWEGAELREVLADVMEPYLRQGPERVKLEGPSLFLSPSATLALAMTVHELATNAAKYGALSLPAGRVSMVWVVGEDGQFRLHWQERGGPVVSAPTRKGFGTRLIERNLAQALGAQVHLTYEPAGVICTIQAPLAELTATSEYIIQLGTVVSPAAPKL